VVFKAWDVKGLWEVLERNAISEASDYYPYDFTDYFEEEEAALAGKGNAFLFEKVPPGSEPRKYFEAIRDWGKRHGIEISFEPHAEHGEILPG